MYKPNSLHNKGLPKVNCLGSIQCSCDIFFLFSLFVFSSSSSFFFSKWQFYTHIPAWFSIRFYFHLLINVFIFFPHLMSQSNFLLTLRVLYWHMALLFCLQMNQNQVWNPWWFVSFLLLQRKEIQQNTCILICAYKHIKIDVN